MEDLDSSPSFRDHAQRFTNEQHSFRPLDNDYKKQLNKLRKFFVDSENKENMIQPQNTKVSSFLPNRDDHPPRFLAEQQYYDVLRSLTQANINQVKQMVKPEKGMSLILESLVAFFVGYEPWLPQDYDFYKKRLSWAELQRYFCHPKFVTLLQKAPDLIKNQQITQKNYQDSLLVYELCAQVQAQFECSQTQKCIINIVKSIHKIYEDEESVVISDSRKNPLTVNFDIDQPQHLFLDQEKLSPIQKQNHDVSLESMLNISERRQVNFDQKKKPSALANRNRSLSAINRTNFDSKKSVSNISLKSTSPKTRIRTDSSITSQSKLTKSNVSTNATSNKLKPAKKQLFQVKPLEKPTKNVDQKKRDLHLVIEHHKKMINKLQDQESRIKWRIEREARQLSRLEQEQKSKEELSWNRQQVAKQPYIKRLKQDQIQRESQERLKKEKQQYYQFKQELRDKSPPKNDFTQDQIYQNLKFERQRIEQKMKESEDRLKLVQSRFSKKSNY